MEEQWLAPWSAATLNNMARQSQAQVSHAMSDKVVLSLMPSVLATAVQWIGAALRL